MTGNRLPLSAGPLVDVVGVWDAPQLEQQIDGGPWETIPVDGGRLVYTADGFMAAIVSLAGSSGVIAYSGRYLVVDHTRIKHLVDVSRPRSWTGTALERWASKDGDRLVLESPAVATAAGKLVGRCTWQRAAL
jgi:hypothetical protein